MAKFYAVLSFLLAFYSGETFACPSTGCNCTETEISCTSLNALPDASELFTNPNTVETVSITNSDSVTEIPEDFFSDMPKLTNIRLTSNQLTSLNELSFQYLPMLLTIDISDNPINCTGDANDWIKTWLAAGESSNLIGTCSDGSQFTDYIDFLNDVAPVMLTFDSPAYTINETETRTITVTCDGDISTAINVRVMVEELSEASEEDFMIQNKELTFSDQESSVTFDLSIPDNSRKDPEGWGFTLRLVPERIIVRSNSARVTLVDDGDDSNASENTEKPEMSSSPAMAPTKEPTSGGGSKVWIAIVILLLLAVIIVIVVFIWKKKQDRKRTTASTGQGDYSAVQGDGDNKVYSATTEEIA